MDRAVNNDPILGPLLASGTAADSEVSFFWEDEVTGTPCKARVDRVAMNGAVLLDLKTTDTASPRIWRGKAAREGHFLRVPWYLDGWELASGNCPKQYLFGVVEKSPPYVVQVYKLEERALAWGRMMMRRALARFAECEVNNLWHQGYQDGIATIGLPTYAEFELAEREQAGDFMGAAA